ncbi:DUF2235 domain-containing protein [Xanthomonas sp. Kuri4-1]
MNGRKQDGDSHRQEADGLLADGVSHYPASEAQLQSYTAASEALAQFRSPRLLEDGNPDQRLFVAAFDGTGNDAEKDPLHATNVAKIHDQILDRNLSGDTRIVPGYVAGPGTQNGTIARTTDGARGHTYDERLEEMYKLFIDQAALWRRENPNARIAVADIGFSRGAEQAAGFSRLVHERGIQDPSGAEYTRDRDGQVIGVHYAKPPLVEPGQVPQAVGLFDPVGTGEPVEQHDRRLPPSVICGFQLIAADERRGLFKATHIIDPGLSADGRLLGVVVAGAHSDVGGSYHRDGLAIRSGNLMTDYLNSLSETPFLEKRAEPLEPGRNVVHRSEEGMLLYRLGSKVDRTQPEGYLERLVPAGRVDKVADPDNAEPVDRVLKARYPYRAVPIGALPEATTDERISQPAPTSSPVPSLSARDWALHDALKARMPAGVDEDRLMQATLQARRGGLDAATLERTQEVNGKLWIIGNVPGFRASLDLSQPAPPVQASAGQLNEFDRQREQAATPARQPEQAPLQGPRM